MISIYKFIAAIGTRAKGDDFGVDNSIPVDQLILIVVSRSLCAIRGLMHLPFLHRDSGTPLFVGRRVKMRCRRRIQIGTGVTISDDVFVDGLSSNGVQIGQGVSIGPNTTIVCTSVLRKIGYGCIIGKGSGIGQFSFLGSGGGIRIGENVIMGQYVSFHTERHNFEGDAEPIRRQVVVRTLIEIGDDCWIGSKSTFLPGAKVGRGCVIAAGAVVRETIPDGAIAAGVPARVVGFRQGVGRQN